MVMAVSSLDPTFGQFGTVLGPVDTGNGPALSNASAVAVQPNGDLVVVGTVDRPAAGGATNFPTLAVRRYLPNGTLDATFGTNGQADVSAPTGYDSVLGSSHNVVVEPNGDIVFAASYSQKTQPGQAFPGGDVPYESVVIRLLADGRLDTSFGANGQAATGVNARLDAVAVQPDGKIVAAGTGSGPLVGDTTYEVVRLTTSGTLDTNFNTTGTLQVPVPQKSGSGSLDAVQVALDGKILFAGTDRYDSSGSPVYLVVVGRVNSDGTLDNSYGSNGLASFFKNNEASLNVADMALKSDGSAVLVGDVLSTAFALSVNPNGTGSAPTPVMTPGVASPSLVVSYRSVVVQPDGKIVVVGSSVDPKLGPIPPSRDTFGLVDRYLPTGSFDPTFGVDGRVEFSTVPPSSFASSPNLFVTQTFNSVATTSLGNIVAVGTVTDFTSNPNGTLTTTGTQAVLSQFLGGPAKRATPGDYTGDGKSDIAAELAAFGAFAYRPSGGGADVIQPFGPAGVGQAIPAPGDYDGDGKTDIAAYLPAYGVLAYRPSSGGPDVIVPFGMAGAGKSIPAPGDYDGDGKTDVAVYLPSLGILAYRPSSGGPDVLTQFGMAGAGKSIPAPGDYDGLGKTDIAVYLPSLGVLAYRPSNGGPDVLTQFGLAGAGKSIPAPGDYDGLGKTDIAVYMPSLGDFAYRPSNGGADVLTPFGLAGPGASIPAPGDYDGDSKTDIAVYMPSLALFAYRPSGGGADVVESFGASGMGQTVPASSIPAAQGPLRFGPSPSSRSVAVTLPLVENPTELSLGSIAKKHRKARVHVV